jgi:[ribosomal protein S5]-alanine N-acetyltransferase
VEHAESGKRHQFESERLTIRLADADDASDLIAYDRRNAAHLAPWEPRRNPALAYDLEWRRSALAQRRGDAEADRGHAFLARIRDGERTGEIVASVTLSNVVRGPFQACHLGYSVDAAHEGHGIAFEAVGAVVRFAFAELRLHRVMANYQPGNERSGKLLRRLGFTVEGYARDYLFIDGAWRDHVLTALFNPDWAAGPGRPAG